MHKTIFRYVLREQLVPFATSLLVLTLVLFLGKTMRYTRVLFATDAGLADLGRLLLFSLPYFLAFTIPMATLLAVLLAFARLASDNEIIAMNASGISLYQLLPPVAVVVGASFVACLLLNLFILPAGNHSLRALLVSLARTRAELALKEQVFNDQFPGLVFLVNHISADGRDLEEIFISDERDPKVRNTIVAKTGSMRRRPEADGLILNLRDGTILRVDVDTKAAQLIRFHTYVLNLRLAAAGSSPGRKGAEQMTLSELRAALAQARPESRKYYDLSLEFHRRLSLPFACVVLGLAAAPLSLQFGRVTRLSGVVLGLVLFLLYYVMMSAASALGENGLCPPAVGLWLPNLLFAGVALGLWIQAARERPATDVAHLHRLTFAVMERCRRARRRHP